MQILDIIRSAQGGQFVGNLARQFGLTPQQANALLEAVLPQLSAGIERNTLSRGVWPIWSQRWGMGITRAHWTIRVR